MKLVIVGGGLAGSIPAHVANSLGIEVVLFDDGQKFGASRSSENLFSTSWTSTLGMEVAESGVNLLGKYFTINTIPFWTGKRVNETLHIPVKRILWSQPIPERVVSVRDGEVTTASGRVEKGVVLVAAGWWSTNFGLDIPPIDSLTGHGFLIPGVWGQAPVMNFWAPYRHQKIFQWSYEPNLIWYGDSTTIVDRNYREADMVKASLVRAIKAGAPVHKGVRIVYGRRPFCPSSKKGFFKQLAPQLFISTSGWKCGLVIYAHQTRLLFKALGVSI